MINKRNILLLMVIVIFIMNRVNGSNFELSTDILNTNFLNKSNFSKRELANIDDLVELSKEVSNMVGGKLGNIFKSVNSKIEDLSFKIQSSNFDFKQFDDQINHLISLLKNFKINNFDYDSVKEYEIATNNLIDSINIKKKEFGNSNISTVNQNNSTGTLSEFDFTFTKMNSVDGLIKNLGQFFKNIKTDFESNLIKEFFRYILNEKGIDYNSKEFKDFMNIILNMKRDEKLNNSIDTVLNSLLTANSIYEKLSLYDSNSNVSNNKNFEMNEELLNGMSQKLDPKFYEHLENVVNSSSFDNLLNDKFFAENFSTLFNNVKSKINGNEHDISENSNIDSNIDIDNFPLIIIEEHNNQRVILITIIITIIIVIFIFLTVIICINKKRKRNNNSFQEINKKDNKDPYLDSSVIEMK